MKQEQHRKQLRSSSVEEIGRMLQDERKTLFMARRDSASKQLANPKQIKTAKKNIARIFTILRERELESAKGTK